MTMTAKQRAYIRTLAEQLGWTEDEALAQCVAAANGAHHATNEARVARSGATFATLSAGDAYRLTAWLRKSCYAAGSRPGDPDRYRAHLEAIENADGAL